MSSECPAMPLPLISSCRSETISGCKYRQTNHRPCFIIDMEGHITVHRRSEVTIPDGSTTHLKLIALVADTTSTCPRYSKKHNSWARGTLTASLSCKRHLPSQGRPFTKHLLAYSDLQHATSSDPAKRHTVAMEIQKASLTAGFFYSTPFSCTLHDGYTLIDFSVPVKNHGVDETKVEKTFRQAEAFFATSPDVKKSVSDLARLSSDTRGLLISWHMRIGRHFQIRKFPRVDGRLDREQRSVSAFPNSRLKITNPSLDIGRTKAIYTKASISAWTRRSLIPLHRFKS